MNTRHKCPSCDHRTKTFSLYIDVESSAPLHPNVGRCERVDKCGYHFTPKQYFSLNPHLNEVPLAMPKPDRRPKKIAPSFIDRQIFKRSLSGYDSNNFITFLRANFDATIVQSLIAKYFIGSSNHWPCSTVFWQIDRFGNVRTGKVMLYGADTGKRIKIPFNHITWAHKALSLPDFNLSQCLFGEHLLIDSDKPAAIVESEKTAIIASIFFPKYIWLACGSLQNLSADRCGVLKNRPTVLYPDLNAFDKWTIKAKELGFQVSETLEKVATDAERSQGLDLADFIIKTSNINHKHFDYEHNL